MKRWFHSKLNFLPPRRVVYLYVLHCTLVINSMGWRCLTKVLLEKKSGYHLKWKQTDFSNWIEPIRPSILPNPIYFQTRQSKIYNKLSSSMSGGGQNWHDRTEVNKLFVLTGKWAKWCPSKFHVASVSEQWARAKNNLYCKYIVR